MNSRKRPTNPAELVFAYPLVVLRDLIARKLPKLGITPNLLTILGTVFTLCAGWTLARGAEQDWSGSSIPASFWAGWWLILACAMDMLDGAVAKLNNMKTPFGGILDSTMDRISDIAIFGGISVAYGRLGNATFHILALIALTNGVLISYIKARAEPDVPDCGVGYWQRGERMVAVLVGCFSGHISTLIVMMAILPALTVLSRLRRCYRWQQGRGLSVSPLPTSSSGRLASLAFWRYGRGTWPHVAISVVYILALAFVSIAAVDPLARFFAAANAN